MLRAIEVEEADAQGRYVVNAYFFADRRMSQRKFIVTPIKKPDTARGKTTFAVTENGKELDRFLAHQGQMIPRDEVGKSIRGIFKSGR